MALADAIDTDDRTWRRVIDINLSGGHFCSRQAARVMVCQKRGAIVNISSINNGRGGEEPLTAYSASKFGVMGTTKTMAAELGEHGIRVNSEGAYPILYDYDHDPHEMHNLYSQKYRAGESHLRLLKLAEQTSDPLESVVAARTWPGRATQKRGRPESFEPTRKEGTFAVGESLWTRNLASCTPKWNRSSRTCSSYR